MNVLVVGALASLIAGLMAAVGALPLAFVGNIPQRFLNPMLGFAAGVILAATVFSLVQPGIEEAGGLYGAFVMVAGIMLGGIFVDFFDRRFTRQHFVQGHEGPKRRLSGLWLFVIAITLHNFPEGLAVGVGFGQGGEESIRNGLTLALAIGLQDLPKGLAVAAALIGEGYGAWKAIGISALIGLVETAGGVLRVIFVNLSQPLLPWGMALAAGAMLFVISDEIIPEIHSGGFDRVANFGVMVGFVVMMFLDVTLG
ncbi:MAG: ZIP family metal transporter [Actinomycetota bacterium]|nr:ZIP family metal transporter [Actinomycetota bacterium]